MIKQRAFENHKPATPELMEGIAEAEENEAREARKRKHSSRGSDITMERVTDEDRYSVIDDDEEDASKGYEILVS